ncbi:major outer membrane protein [[Haemophilus] ducreyi]|nr:major outer membrane protein [[Haemophilus] ducreyi]
MLDATNTEIVNLGLATPAIQVNGYTDRIGSGDVNLKLSQRRAETVANYLVAKGQNPVSINAVGYGEVKRTQSQVTLVMQ